MTFFNIAHVSPMNQSINKLSKLSKLIQFVDTSIQRCMGNIKESHQNPLRNAAISYKIKLPQKILHFLNTCSQIELKKKLNQFDQFVYALI